MDNREAIIATETLSISHVEPAVPWLLLDVRTILVIEEDQDEEETNNVIDKEFYIKAINRCLASICRAIALSDEQHVITKSYGWH